MLWWWKVCHAPFPIVVKFSQLEVLWVKVSKWSTITSVVFYCSGQIKRPTSAQEAGKQMPSPHKRNHKAKGLDTRKLRSLRPQTAHYQKKAIPETSLLCILTGFPLSMPTLSCWSHWNKHRLPFSGSLVRGRRCQCWEMKTGWLYGR